MRDICQGKILLLVLIVFIIQIFPNEVFADCTDDLENLVGYTIIDSKTIERWYDDNEKEESFNGCSHGRVIVFTDGTRLKCAEYGYMYAYRPTAIIFARQFSLKGIKGGSFYDIKMMVEDEIYDMRR